MSVAIKKWIAALLCFLLVSFLGALIANFSGRLASGGAYFAAAGVGVVWMVLLLALAVWSLHIEV